MANSMDNKLKIINATTLINKLNKKIIDKGDPLESIMETFAKITPIPKGKSMYDYYGTKVIYSGYGENFEINDQEISMFFTTAWTEPSTLYQNMIDNEYTIMACYISSESSVYGYYSNDSHEQFELNFIDFDIEKDIPHDMFLMLKKEYKDWKYMELEEENPKAIKVIKKLDKYFEITE